MELIFNIIYYIIFNAIFVFAIVLILVYTILAIIASVEIKSYYRRTNRLEVNAFFSSNLTPTISIVAPALNEESSIVQNVRSMLNLHYTSYDVIVVNDGSTDNSLRLLIDAFDLTMEPYPVYSYLDSQPIRGIYRSQNQSFHRLTVVDKENGGKSDALNAGINISQSQYIVVLDVDSLLEQDALTKIIRPVLDEPESQVIAVGAVIGIANSCEVYNGKVVNVILPDKILPRVQVFEYTRSFLMGRLAWSRINGLLLVSGAFGIFDRDIIIKSGGYSTSTVGEDMELVVRMRRYMIENKLKYKVKYIPEPLCWTMAPEDLGSLSRQRNRWMRGTIETLRLHKKIALNPKYGTLGMLGYPFWYLFEWLAPIIELFGLIYFFILVGFGLVNWTFFFIMFGFVYTFGVTFSIWALVFEEFTYHRYEKKRDLFKSLIVILLEPIFYHPIMLLISIKANIDYFIFGKRSWGSATRKSFSTAKV